MVTPKQLVERVSQVLGFQESTVACHDRNLQEAGLRKRAKRGRANNAVTSTDAAALIIAVLTSESVNDSANAVTLRKEYIPLIASLLDSDFESLAARTVSLPIRKGSGVSIDAVVSQPAFHAIASLIYS